MTKCDFSWTFILSKQSLVSVHFTGNENQLVDTWGFYYDHFVAFFLFLKMLSSLCGSFVQGPHWWCIQGHVDIKDLKVGCHKISDSKNHGVEKSCPKARQWADKCLTVGKKWMWIRLFLALKGFLSGSQLYNLRCWSSLNVPTGISKQYTKTTHDNSLLRRNDYKTFRVMD